MQIKLFTIPVGDGGGALLEMNAFLRGNKILEVENKLMGNENGAYWCFCVRYIERAHPEAGGEKEGKKVDYKKVLDEATFGKFSKLREIRKNGLQPWTGRMLGWLSCDVIQTLGLQTLGLSEAGGCVWSFATNVGPHRGRSRAWRVTLFLSCR